ncbi:MAG TPA: histidine phosphatase family protein [Thermodesulfobacteriota bacterium]|nr:histidine phosphatase family protein [Thermodesulfobacteriota bacterium]
MELILWRHAEAEQGGSDDTRALTPAGRQQAAAMAAWLKPRLPATARVLTSPALRARQTAQALTDAAAVSPQLAYPAPGITAATILEAAGWPRGEGVVVVVGHQPVLGQAAALALTGREAPWAIPPGGLWWLASGAEPPRVRAVLSPELL